MLPRRCTMLALMGVARETSPRGDPTGHGELLNLAEVRLLRKARHRDPVALAGLWECVVDDAWSVACALVPEPVAVEALLAARDALVAGAPRLPADSRWVEVPFGQLFEELHRALGLRPLSTVDPEVWEASSRPPKNAKVHRDPEAARRAVRVAPPELRLVYLFTLLTPCSHEAVARFAGVGPSVVRQARTAAPWRVIEELQR